MLSRISAKLHLFTLSYIPPMRACMQWSNFTLTSIAQSIKCSQSFSCTKRKSKRLKARRVSSFHRKALVSFQFYGHRHHYHNMTSLPKDEENINSWFPILMMRLCVKHHIYGYFQLTIPVTWSHYLYYSALAVLMQFSPINSGAHGITVTEATVSDPLTWPDLYDIAIIKRHPFVYRLFATLLQFN